MSSVSTIASQPQASARVRRLGHELVGATPVELEPARTHRPSRRRTPPSASRPGSRRRSARSRPRPPSPPRDRHRGARARARRSGRAGTGSAATAGRAARRPGRAAETSRRMRGTMRRRSNAAGCAAIVLSSACPTRDVREGLAPHPPAGAGLLQLVAVERDRGCACRAARPDRPPSGAGDRRRARCSRARC